MLPFSCFHPMDHDRFVGDQHWWHHFPLESPGPFHIVQPMMCN